MTGSWHEPAAWLIVKVAVPIWTVGINPLLVLLLTGIVPVIVIGEVEPMP
jgi:hypothetical protein